MKTLSGLSATPFQNFQVSFQDKLIDFTLKYFPAVRMWFIDITVDDIEIKNIRICHNLNLLAQYSNILNFGIFVDVNGITEPVLVDDFSAERATLNLLTSDEISIINEGYSILR